MNTCRHYRQAERFAREGIELAALDPDRVSSAQPAVLLRAT